MTGAVSVTANPANHAITLRITGLTGKTAVGSAVELSAATIKSGDARLPVGLSYEAAKASASAHQHFTLPSDKSPGWENPSFLHDVVLTSQVFPTTDGCTVGIVAYAPLAWTVGDPRPDIHVGDRGARRRTRADDPRGWPAIVVHGRRWRLPGCDCGQILAEAQRAVLFESCPHPESAKHGHPSWRSPEPEQVLSIGSRVLLHALGFPVYFYNTCNCASIDDRLPSRLRKRRSQQEEAVRGNRR